MGYREFILKKESAGCLLCYNAPCAQACPENIKTDEILRSLNFLNEGNARYLLGDCVCADCESKACMSACTKGKFDVPVDIARVNTLLREAEPEKPADVDLSTELCGVRLENPFLLSSSVVGSNYEMVAKAFDMGWAGVAFKTVGMFVPNEVSPRFDSLEKEGTAFVGFKNAEQISDHPLEENLGFFRKLKENYPEKIIIASIMGRDEDEWEQLASLCEEAGADILECNFSCPQMVGEGMGSDVGINPQLVASYVKAVKRGSSLPVLAKMTPNITDMTVPALAAVNAGADGLAAINTIKSVMNINPDTFSSGPDVGGKSTVSGYSGKAVKPIALRFIRDMAVCKGLSGVPISGMGGIESWYDAMEFMALGCSTVQVTTSVMQYGYRVIDDMLDGMKRFMAKHGYKSVNDFIGEANKNLISADDLDRSSICFPRFDGKLCTGCGRCYLSCYDGGHQAIKINGERKPVLNGKKCVGCHLCVSVCPVGAITPGKKVLKAT